MRTLFPPLFLVAALVAGIVSAQADDRRRDRSRLVVMTLNAEFLWDGDGRVRFARRGSPAAARAHMAEIAALIIRNDPDVINLVEVEGLVALRRFAARYLAGRGYRAYLVAGTDRVTGQDVGLLTRIDPVSGTIHRDRRRGRAGGIAKSVSKNYYARLHVGGLKLGLIAIHYLARPHDRARRAKREAQAAATRALAIRLAAEGYLPIVLGDFNDYDGADGTRDHLDNRPISDVLAIVKSMAGADPADDLVNLLSLVAKADRYTAFWDRNRNGRVDRPSELSAIDHILVAPDLAKHVIGVEIPHDHDPRRVTDHFPLVAHFRLPAPGTASNEASVTPGAR